MADSHLINISTPSLQALLEKRCFMTLIAFEPDILIKIEILLKNTQMKVLANKISFPVV